MTIRNAFKKIYSKSGSKSGGGSGGATGYTNPKNSYFQTLHMADFMVALTRDIDSPKERYVKIIKNRDGINGRADPQTTIELSCRMIAMSVFGDTLKLFRVDLEEAIKETIMNKIGDAHDPFHRKSTGDGT